MNEMAYRANFWIQTFESLLSMATALATIAIVFNQTDSLGGWQRAELISLLGVYFLVLGTINLVVSPSLGRFMEEVVDGRLDFTLTKPADAQLLVSISEFRIWKILDVILGLIVLSMGLLTKAEATSFASALVFGITLLAAGAIVYSFWIILATLAFWFIRIENITMIFWSMYTAGRWPVTIYPPWLKWILTLLVPVAFAVTVPAQALSGRLTFNTLMSAVLLAVALVFISRWFWKLGVKSYSGASA
jgi:ABC-2 type transport system permease protein